jgi:hypothetical protein
MVALGEKELKDNAAMTLEPLGVGSYIHALEYRGHAGGEQLVAALYFDHAQAAGANIAEAVEMTESGNVDVVFARHFEDRLAGAGAHFLAINGECFYVDAGGSHANTSNGEAGEEEACFAQAGW